jgi:hypothetical protein
LKRSDLLGDLRAFALGAPEFGLLVLRNGKEEGKLATAFIAFEIVVWHTGPPSTEMVSQMHDNQFRVFVNSNPGNTFQFSVFTSRYSQPHH